jgi:hypothetical protein
VLALVVDGAPSQMCFHRLITLKCSFAEPTDTHILGNPFSILEMERAVSKQFHRNMKSLLSCSPDDVSLDVPEHLLNDSQ